MIRIVLFGVAAAGLVGLGVWGCVYIYKKVADQRKLQALRRMHSTEMIGSIVTDHFYSQQDEQQKQPLIIDRDQEQKKKNVNQEVKHLNSMEFDNLKAELTCPITQEVLRDPVRTPFGHVFERLAILNYIKRKKECPLTRKKLQVQDLTTCTETKSKLNILKALVKQ